MFFKLATWNVNGLRSILKKGNLINYISQSSPDILCLNEIRIDENLLEKSSIQTIFSPFYPYQKWCCSLKKGYSGVAILSKQKPLNSYDFFPDSLINDNKFKGRIGIMEFIDFYVITLYSPNSGDELKNLSYRIDVWEINLLESLLKLNKNLIICGDLNVAYTEKDIYNPNTSKYRPGFTDQERKFFGYILEKGFIDCFRDKYPNEVQYTWWNPRNKQAREEKKGWRLDYFLTNKENIAIMKDCVIREDVYGSDHCPVELIMDLKKFK